MLILYSPYCRKLYDEPSKPSIELPYHPASPGKQAQTVGHLCQHQHYSQQPNNRYNRHHHKRYTVCYIDVCMHKHRHTHTMETLLSVRILTHVTAWINLEYTMQSEISWSQKDKHSMISLTTYNS